MASVCMVLGLGVGSPASALGSAWFVSLFSAEDGPDAMLLRPNQQKHMFQIAP